MTYGAAILLRECFGRPTSARIFTKATHVVHQRNDHNNLGDLNGEQDLYMKSVTFGQVSKFWTAQ